MAVLALDRRTRTDAHRGDHTVDELLDAVLPDLVGGPHHDVAARGAAALELPSLTITVEGRSVTLDTARHDLVVRPGNDGATGVSATRYGLNRLLTDQTSAVVLMLEGEITPTAGPPGALIAWEPVLRALFSGWAVYEPGSIALVDRAGAPLDVGHVFTPADDPADVGHFIGEAGFLHARGFVDGADLADLQAACDHFFAIARPGDAHTRTNRRGDGTEVITALEDFSARWPRLAEILRQPAIAGLATIVPGTGFVAPTTAKVQHKSPGVAEGFANTPWHRDCGPGGHSYECCRMRLGLALTADGDGTGMFGAIGGSHRANVSHNPFALPEELPKRMLSCVPGDIHIHLSCTFHRGTPPTTQTRRLLYCDFVLPGVAVERADSAYRDGRVSAAVATAVASSAQTPS